MKNLVLLFSILSISIVHSFGQLYVRYNQKGYSLAQKKELIILTNTNSTNEAWTFSKDNKVVLQGKLGNSLTGKGDFVPTSFSYAVDFSSITEAGIYTFTIKTENKSQLEIIFIVN